MNLSKIIIIISAIGAICFIGWVISLGYEMTLLDSKDPVVIVNTIPDEYLGLFNDSAKNEVKVKVTKLYKLRNGISQISIDVKYALEVTKLDSIFSYPLNRAITEEYMAAEGSGVRYRPGSENGFEMNYKAIDKSNPAKIKLLLCGEDIATVIKNDSVACYYLKLKNFGVRYNDSDEDVIFGESGRNEDYNNIAMNIMFLRKHNALYFLVLAPKNISGDLPPKTLYNLVVK